MSIYRQLHCLLLSLLPARILSVVRTLGLCSEFSWPLKLSGLFFIPVHSFPNELFVYPFIFDTYCSILHY